MQQISKKHPLVIAFVGMPGAGKSSCVEFLKEKGYPSVYFGGITLDEVKRRGLEPTQANERIVREDLRIMGGNDIYAKMMAEQIEHLADAGQLRIVADGLYTWPEYKYFKKHFGHNAIIIAVTAPRWLRHERLAKRPVRPLAPQEAALRDYTEIETLEKGGPIANADYTLSNDGSVEEIHKQLDALLRKIKFYEQ
ncbi:MAG TPA: AAA family ATPase [Verrucomicrobiae bacterium]|nr:AAA family ATPase [Verrucomicrobiae bacterium]